MPYKWKVLCAIAFGTYMATMDQSIVNIALPTLAREMDAAPDTVIWVALTSSLVATGLTLTAGRAGDLYGRKRVYLLGWSVFTTGMALAVLTQNVYQLIATRAFQAVGAAMAIGNSNAIVTESFPAHERGRALGTTGAIVGAGLTTGPLLGGLILSYFNWHAIFYLRIPIGLLALTLAWLVVKEPPRQPGTRRMDIPGAAALFLSLASLLLGVNRGQSLGWTSPVILGLLGFGVAALALFLRIEAREPSPILSLALFKVRVFSASVLSLILNFAGQASVTFLMPFYLIQVRGFSTARAGLVTVTVPVMMLFLSPLSGYISDRYRFRYQTALGCALVTCGLLALSTVGADAPLPLVMARLALLGIGSALFQSPNSSVIMSSVPRSALGTASAGVATGRNIGNSIGLAMAGTILVGVASAAAGVHGVRADQLPADALLKGIRVAFRVGAGASTLAIVASLLRGSIAGLAAATAPPVPVAAGKSADD